MDDTIIVSVLDEDFNTVAIIDNYKSFIWTDRYCGYGDFELYIPIDGIDISIFRLGRYVRKRTILQNDNGINYEDQLYSYLEPLMIIEKLEIKASIEDGDVIIVTGRSLESLLSRRIVWGRAFIRRNSTDQANFQSAIAGIFAMNVYPCPNDGSNPLLVNNELRQISFLRFMPTADENVLKRSVTAQYTGDNVYDVVKNLCQRYQLGFSVRFCHTPHTIEILGNAYALEKNKMYFQLYSGVDRSYEQNTNPYVVFSKKFNNLLASDYSENEEKYKNTALVAGEGEGDDRVFTSINGEVARGLERREMFVDARDISRQRNDEEPIPLPQYIQTLKTRGNNKLLKNTYEIKSEADVDYRDRYIIYKDYFLGDWVQFDDGYKVLLKSSISEIITAHDDKGVSIYPTFDMDGATRLPDTFQKVEYIQAINSGSNCGYIDTGVTISENCTGEIEFQFAVGGVPTGGSRESTIFSAYGGSATGWQGGTDSSGAFFTGRGVTYYQNGASELTVEGVWTEAFADEFQRGEAPNSLSLFGQLEENQWLHTDGNKLIKSVKIRDNGSLIACLFPCYRKKDGKVGMYDTVRHLFFTNSNEQAPNFEFIAGPAIK